MASSALENAQQITMYLRSGRWLAESYKQATRGTLNDRLRVA
jgi:hypothetical protein